MTASSDEERLERQLAELNEANAALRARIEELTADLEALRAEIKLLTAPRRFEPPALDEDTLP